MKDKADSLGIAGMALGIMLIVTFFLSIGSIVQANHKTMPLVVLNWLLLFDSIAIAVIGSFVWFFTLKERDAFHKIWLALSDTDKISLQDQVCLRHHKPLLPRLIKYYSVQLLWLFQRV